MPSVSGSIAHYDLNDPEDLQVLIRTGLVWRGGPKAVQRALRAVQDGTATRYPEKETPEVSSYLDKLGVARPEPRNEAAVGPEAEPTVLDEEDEGGLA